MKKKLVSVIGAVVLVMSMVVGIGIPAHADTGQPLVDGSYLTDDEESIGYAVLRTRGEDLQAGYSKVARLGPGKLYAGGTTLAHHNVESIQVSVVVERCEEEGDDWEFVDSWHKENTNTNTVNSSKVMDVEGGYYYRVTCTHSAGNDMSSSFTDGIFIEEP